MPCLCSMKSFALKIQLDVVKIKLKNINKYVPLSGGINGVHFLCDDNLGSSRNKKGEKQNYKRCLTHILG